MLSKNVLNPNTDNWAYNVLAKENETLKIKLEDALFLGTYYMLAFEQLKKEADTCKAVDKLAIADNWKLALQDMEEVANNYKKQCSELQVALKRRNKYILLGGLGGTLAGSSVALMTSWYWVVGIACGLVSMYVSYNLRD